MKIVDLHCDTVSLIYETGQSLWENKGHFDIKRALTSHLGIQFFALFTMHPNMDYVLRQICRQIDKFFEEFVKNSQYLYLIKSFDDINQNKNNSKLGCLLHLEGSEALGADIEILRIFYRLGLRVSGSPGIIATSWQMG